MKATSLNHASLRSGPRRPFSFGGHFAGLSTNIYGFVVPARITQIHVACFGTGGAGNQGGTYNGGGGGGGLAYRNNIPVTPFEVLNVQVGFAGSTVVSQPASLVNGNPSYVARGTTRLCEAFGGTSAPRTAVPGGVGGGRNPVSPLGGNGGQGGTGNSTNAGGGGGAGGWAGNGGVGGNAPASAGGAALAPARAAGGGGGNATVGAGGGGQNFLNKGSGGAAGAAPAPTNGGNGMNVLGTGGLTDIQKSHYWHLFPIPPVVAGQTPTAYFFGGSPISGYRNIGGLNGGPSAMATSPVSYARGHGGTYGGGGGGNDAAFSPNICRAGHGQVYILAGDGLSFPNNTIPKNGYRIYFPGSPAPGSFYTSDKSLKANIVFF